MKRKIFEFLPLKAFTTPFDVKTPMPRIDFWIFYLVFTMVACLTLISLGQIEHAISIGESFFMAFSATAGLLWLLYLMAVLAAATARRMRDSGYRRAILPVSLLTLAGAGYGLFSDAERAYIRFQATGQADRVAYSQHTIVLAVATLVCFFYVFLGVSGRQRAKK